MLGEKAFIFRIVSMEKYIIFILTNVVYDLSASLVLKRIYNLKCKKIYLLCLQIFSVSASVIFLFAVQSELLFLVMKFFVGVLICLLTSEDYGLKDILSKICAWNILLLSIVGFYKFLSLIYVEIISQIFNEKTAKKCQIYEIFAIFLQYMIIFKLVDYFKNKKQNEKLCFNFEFYLFDEHIVVTGFIDSGNGLVDSKTHMPIVIVSLGVIKKHLSEKGMLELTEQLKCARIETCKTIDGHNFKLPILDISNAQIEKDNKKFSVNCVLGVVSQSVYDESEFECLLSKSFL